VTTAANLRNSKGQSPSSRKGRLMENLNSLSLGRKLVLGAGVLLLIDTFLHWQEVSVGGFSGGQSGWHGFWGVLIGLMTIAVLLWVAARAFGVAIPGNLPEGFVTLALAALILLFAVIKVLSDNFVHWPAYLGIVLAAVLAYGAFLVFKDSGEAFPSMPKTAGTNAGPTTPTAPPPTAPPEDPGV
jgi:hypothetical protein